MNVKAFNLDMLERSGWTFVQTFAGTWLGGLVIGSSTLLDLSAGDRLSIAAAAGLIAVAKSIVVRQLPWTANDWASTLPASVDPPQEPVKKAPAKKAAAKKTAR